MNYPPRFLFLDINQQCNLRCRTCMYWSRKEVPHPGHISVARRSELIEEFAELNPAGSVVACGGESLLNPERYFPVTRQCAELGLGCLSVTNGTMVDDDAAAERMISEGPSEITVSLNSHVPVVHDRTRGVKGSFEMATGAIRRLLAARERLGRYTPVYAMAIICEQNYRDLDDFYHFVLVDLKADKLKLNILQPTFAPMEAMEHDIFYRKNLIRDHEELGRIITACDRKYSLNLDPEWIRVVKLYHRSMHENRDAGLGWAAAGTGEPICDSYERNIMVDMFGVARLCFSTGFPGTRLAARGDLEAFWYQESTLREEMASCTRCCGISHSVRRVQATLKTSAVAGKAGGIQPGSSAS